MSKYKHGNNIYKNGEQQNKSSHKFVLNVSQRIDLRSSNKHVAVQNLSIYNTWKNIRQQDKKKTTQNNSSNVEWWVCLICLNDELPDDGYKLEL